MGLRNRLRRLDSRVLRGLRRPDESAEDYLRRAAAGRAASGVAGSAEMVAALREYFTELDRRGSESSL